ncbi:integrator complex subunit 7-like isoform X2 [Acanthaster planci]|nr:integrator complex subunit 7-like isoform X2 [Acanthaster planci]XP_022103793.1 integrator complex subunit 7-like isoform X2 [Acanthaster planci]XP_022103794.1 integrator complex subunit 7-like isoform X2 [Acanthaster planci]
MRLSAMPSDAGYGEQEQDANTALLELDKGLRSLKVGEQCEAIVRFPQLFEKYPFPILINSAFLKLADVFRDGSNFLRLCVVKVAQQSRRHLDKILNVDEFIRRIFFVIHSNDPVARAITLRVLGSIAGIIAEKKNIHHSIHNGLDSHDRVELESAIYAASCFSAESRTFASGICHKLAELIRGLSTPTEIKLKLIPIFKHMHYDTPSAAFARQLCLDLLPSYPAKSFLTVTLHTLSQLAAASLVHIPDQVSLLLGYLCHDPRTAVQMTCVQDLCLLARKAPHMWTSENLASLTGQCQGCESPGLLANRLRILAILFGTPALLVQEQLEPIATLCSTLSQHWDVKVAATAIQIRTLLAKWQNVGSGVHDTGDSPALSYMPIAFAAQNIVIQCLAEETKSATEALKVVLGCIRDLSEKCPEALPALVNTLTMSLKSTTGEGGLALCRCLVSLGESRPEDLFTSHLPILQELYTDALKLEQSHSEESNVRHNMLVGLAMLLLLADRKGRLCPSVSQNIQELVQRYPWPAYRIAHQATRLNCHETAAEIFAKLATQVASEHYYYWLCGLEQFCLGETCLAAITEKSNNLMPCLSKALQHYEKGLSNLKAASTPSHPLLFHCDFMRLRADMLHCCLLLLSCLATIRTCPPPAIAPAVALTMGQELLRCGHMATEMQQCAAQVQQLSVRYARLYQTSFDADPDSLSKIKLIQQQCLLLGHAIDCLVLNNPAYSGNKQWNLLGSCNAVEGSTGTNKQQAKKQLQMTNTILKDLQNVLVQTDGQSISHQHVNCLTEACAGMMRLPFGFPRYFFQALQSTSIKLALSPTARNPNEPVSLSTDTHLAMKVEGVIQHGSKPGLFRKVSKVKLAVTSSCTTAKTTGLGKSSESDSGTSEGTWYTEPHHDYFSIQILLSLPVVGTHTINVEASVVDEDGSCWQTGPRLSLLVKTYEELSLQQRQQQASQQTAGGR